MLTHEQWIKVLHLAQLWGFAGIRDIAIQELESSYSKQVDEVGKLEIALKYKIERWYMDAYTALAKRKEPLSVEEGQRLGLELSLKLAQVREKRLARSAGPAHGPGVGFAPFGGAYLPFGSNTQASASTGTSSFSVARNVICRH